MQNYLKVSALLKLDLITKLRISNPFLTSNIRVKRMMECDDRRKGEGIVVFFDK